MNAPTVDDRRVDAQDAAVRMSPLGSEQLVEFEPHGVVACRRAPDDVVAEHERLAGARPSDDRGLDAIFL